VFDPPLIPAELVKRYKRFLADVRLADGTVATAHCPNSGAMLGLKQPGSRVWLSDQRMRKTTKLDWRLELVEADGAPVGINTQLPNRLVGQGLRAGWFAPILGAHRDAKAEVKYDDGSRIDHLLQMEDGRPLWLEIKNVHLRRLDVADGRIAEFPDCVTARGAKHLGALARRVAAGDRAALLYLVQRGDCDRVGIAEDLDPTYAAACREAWQAGVEFHACACRITPQAITLDRPLPVILPQ